MDGENNGKPYEQMDDLGYHDFWKHPYRDCKKHTILTWPMANLLNFWGLHI